MVTKRICNRCGGKYSPMRGGNLKLQNGYVEIEAYLCESCYTDLVGAYRSAGDD